MSAPITLDMRIPNGADGWTLAEAVEDLKKRGMTGLLEDDLDKISEAVFQFARAVRRGESPTIGQVLAAYYEARTAELEKAYWEDDAITKGQYRYRTGVIKRLVFRSGNVR
ncbi:hypothetical protein [Sphaerisporangium sp. NPDC051011]|uniref:hypothetical protein n=1 Tax=Sphaerisporangium sp. NPDC051011 TaxID=3155792 RepID=UPI0033C5B188